MTVETVPTVTCDDCETAMNVMDCCDNCENTATVKTATVVTVTYLIDTLKHNEFQYSVSIPLKLNEFKFNSISFQFDSIPNAALIQIISIQFNSMSFDVQNTNHVSCANSRSRCSLNTYYVVCYMCKFAMAVSWENMLSRQLRVQICDSCVLGECVKSRVSCENSRWRNSLESCEVVDLMTKFTMDELF